ncbi:MAG: glycosyltransferase [Patescibacteria group bacterium]
MRIGIDISQIAYEHTGVAGYLRRLVEELLRIDKENEYVLFFSSLRRRIQNSKFKIQNHNSKVKIKEFMFPPTLLDILWNRLHIFPIEWFIGDVDIFITSDWTEPPAKRAKKATIIYDLIVYKYPNETDRKIVETQRRKLEWVKKESDIIFCISEATKKDAMEILGIEGSRLKVIYPGI